MTRAPLGAHLCAADPDAWAAGFDAATAWVQHAGPAAALVHAAIRDSTGRPWLLTARAIGVPATAWHEGWALGVYGEVEARSPC